MNKYKVGNLIVIEDSLEPEANRIYGILTEHVSIPNYEWKAMLFFNDKRGQASMGTLTVSEWEFKKV